MTPRSDAAPRTYRHAPLMGKFGPRGWLVVDDWGTPVDYYEGKGAAQHVAEQQAKSAAARFNKGGKAPPAEEP